MSTNTIFISAITGAIATLIIQAFTRKTSNDRIRTTIKIYLDKLSKDISSLKNDYKTIESSIITYNFKDIELDLHPGINSNVLKSFPLQRLQSIYGDKLISLLQLIDKVDYHSKYNSLEVYNSFINESDSLIRQNTVHRGKNIEENKIYYDQNITLITMTRRLNKDLILLQNSCDEILTTITNF